MHCQEVVRRRVARVRQTEVGHTERVGGVFERGHRVVGARRHVVDGVDGDAAAGGRRAERAVAAGDRGVRHRARHACDLVPRTESDAAHDAAVPVCVRHEAHVGVAIRREQAGAGVGRDAECRPHRAAVERVLPHAVAVVDRRDPDAARGPGVRVGDPAGDQRRHQRAAVPRRVFVDSREVVRAGEHRRIVGRHHVKRHHARRCFEIDAAVGRAAVVLHLEGELRIRRAERIERRRVGKLAGVDVRHAHELPGCHRNTIVGEAARARQRGDPDRQQRMARGVVWIGEPEFRGGETVGGVLGYRYRVAGSRRRVVDRDYADGDGIARDQRAAEAGIAEIIDSESQCGRPVEIRRRNVTHAIERRVDRGERAGERHRRVRGAVAGGEREARRT